jgi:3-hydroxyacyl-[acyl-carrier-protein] dehydratase
MLRIAPDHPAFAGHFPGMPILPGALLLDEALMRIGADLGLDLREWQIASAKFSAPVRPGDELSVEHAAEPDAIRFAVRIAGRVALAGTLSKLTPGGADDA